ncbi:MAG TPA: hypothetical protein VKD90_15455 [Gemmataceae bacterium]|nr:hypothetical protein [Gemmataceae bacterium]
MRQVVFAAVLLGLTAGCGGDPKPNTAPMTEEEVRQMRDEDRRIDEAEKSGSGSATPAKSRKR